jgi:hypothetical protein
MPKGRGQPPRAIPPGMTFMSWVVIREVERVGYNRRFECRCSGCGSIHIKWLANLLRAKGTCTTCTPLSTFDRRSLEAFFAYRRELFQVSAEGRICHTCQTWKPWSCFSRDPRRSTGKASNCMKCSRWRVIKSIYGITRAEWEWLYESQGGLCALCREVDAVSLAVDHDHTCCGKIRACKKCIRGMLCHICNLMLGHADNKPALAARFADYLIMRPFAADAGSLTGTERSGA